MIAGLDPEDFCECGHTASSHMWPLLNTKFCEFCECHKFEPQVAWEAR